MYSGKRSTGKWFKAHSFSKVIHYIRQAENENLGFRYDVKI